MTKAYEIRVEGHLSKKFDQYFNGMELTRQPDGTTTITGELVDQTALQSVLFKISSMNIGLISVNSIAAESDPSS
jgi:hypothetical protein